MISARIAKYFLVLFLAITFTAYGATRAKSDDPNFPKNAYLDGKSSKVGVILCHGRGRHPTWNVVNPLRKGIHKQLGYHTLSIQMPVIPFQKGVLTKSRDYIPLFPDAYKRIEASINFLRNKKGIEKIYLMGHSMGSKMVTAYLAANPDAKVDGFIGVGVMNKGKKAVVEGTIYAPLDSNANLRSIKIPVIDIYGDGSKKDLIDAKDRSDMISARYKQVLIPRAKHQFPKRKNQKLMVSAAVEWLKEQNQ